MEVFTLIIVALAALILYVAGKRAYRFYLFYREINKIPGPNFKLPFFGFVCKLMTVKKEDRFQFLDELFYQFKGGITKVWVGFMGVVHVRKPEQIEVILRSNTQISKPKAYEYMEAWLGLGLLTSSGPHWFHSRKLITPAFHFNILEEFTDVMIDKASILNQCIERQIKINGDKPIEIFTLVVKCTLDIICETAMGVNVHAQEEIESEYIKAVHTISSGVLYRIIRPWLKPNWIYYNLPVGKEFKRAVEIAHEHCIRIIKRKQEERKLGYAAVEKSEGDREEELGKRKRKAFLDLLLDVNESENHPMSDQDILDQTNTFMFAGHDTTGALVSWALFCLGNEPDVQQKVHEELDEVIGDADDHETVKLLPNLKYLERVIKETLRLYPSAPNISRYLTEDMQFGKYTVPKGTNLEVVIYKLHKDAEVWPDPLRFDPDRFLPENVRGRHPYAFVPFSAGPRNCIGQKYAMLESKILLTQVLRKFSVKSVESHSSIQKYSELILKPFNGIYVHMKKRC